MLTRFFRASIVPLCLASAVAGPLAALAAPAAEDPRKREPTSWEATLSKPGEPGEPFEMGGIVRGQNGEALANKKVFLYHADSKGRYAASKDEPLRLAAVIRTDGNGRYRIRSVFPGTYGYPAHVHYEVLESPFEVGFVNVRQEGREAPSPEQSVVVKRAKDGVWRLDWDLRRRWSVPRPARTLFKTPEIRDLSRAPADSAR